jgi:hypothetical protein
MAYIGLWEEALKEDPHIVDRIDLAYLRGIKDGLEALGEALNNVKGEITIGEVQDVIGAAYWEAEEVVRAHAMSLYPLRRVRDAASKRAGEVSKPESGAKPKARKRRESRRGD